MESRMSDIEYRMKVYSDIRPNVRVRSLQSDIAGSDVRLSPLPLTTEIDSVRYH
jgi:hypothetical protein